jgi:hypothetical protein
MEQERDGSKSKIVLLRRFVPLLYRYIHEVVDIYDRSSASKIESYSPGSTYSSSLFLGLGVLSSLPGQSLM